MQTHTSILSCISMYMCMHMNVYVGMLLYHVHGPYVHAHSKDPHRYLGNRVQSVFGFPDVIKAKNRYDAVSFY